MRIAIVNDTAMILESLRRIVMSNPDNQLAWLARDGAEAVQRCAVDTLPATLIPRVQTFVWKLSTLYAAMDASENILPKHLELAILAGNYFEQSVLQIFRIFGASHGKEIEDKILTFMHSKGKGIPVSQREVYKSLHISAAELEQAVRPLERIGLISTSTRINTSGRKVLCYEV